MVTTERHSGGGRGGVILFYFAYMSGNSSTVGKPEYFGRGRVIRNGLQGVGLWVHIGGILDQ